NLLDNAVKYSPQGGAIEVRVKAFDLEIEFTVHDGGRGVPPESLEAIFETFFRVRTAETASIKGSGLGLAICRGIVHAHGGRIWASLPPEGGFEVSFTLPKLSLPEQLRVSA